MQVSHTPGAAKRLRKDAGRFQVIFRAPLKRLPEFAIQLLGGVDPLLSATLTIETAVFEPNHLQALLAGVSHEPLRQDTIVTSAGREESKRLLSDALADWIDFFLVPAPKRYVFYADHDEYLTIFGSGKSIVSALGSVLRGEGFECVDGYVREW
ncbi:MAG: hypothetical protein A2Z34_01600 [Planctomycetes bacterium RBG_16_59_8]|nr:MAG: hypothetical protein A2Z34_01600 [Planctomycetes bacterium RBG_16_59_8]